MCMVLSVKTLKSKAYVHELSYEYCNLMTLKGNPPNFTHESLRVL